jgi:hypothetical protein
MAFDQRPDTGLLFRNKDKGSADKKPNYDGNISLVCPGCGTTWTRRLSAWVNTAKSGVK